MQAAQPEQPVEEPTAFTCPGPEEGSPYWRARISAIELGYSTPRNRLETAWFRSLDLAARVSIDGQVAYVLRGVNDLRTLLSDHEGFVTMSDLIVGLLSPRRDTVRPQSITAAQSLLGDLALLAMQAFDAELGVQEIGVNP